MQPIIESGPVTVRMGFAIDVVGYGSRTAPAKLQVQKRVAALVNAVLTVIGSEPTDTHRQVSGDGIMVFLPPTTQIHVALHYLLQTTASWLRRDNSQSPDRLRLRMAAVVGPVGPAILGFSGGTVVQCARLLDSPVLRTTLTHCTSADVVALISEPLYAFSVVEGHPGLNPSDFTPVTVRNKEFKAKPWLWTSSPHRRRRFSPLVPGR